MKKTKSFFVCKDLVYLKNIPYMNIYSKNEYKVIEIKMYNLASDFFEKGAKYKAKNSCCV